MCLYLLSQCQSGFALFSYSLGKNPPRLHMLHRLITKVDDFVNTVKLVEFKKFESNDDARKQIEAFSQGQMTAELHKFLLPNLPEVKAGKENNFSLGVTNPELGYNIYDAAKIPCQSSDFVCEVLKGVDRHFERYIQNIDVMKVDTGNLDYNEVAGGNEDVTKATAKSSGKKKFSELDVEETPMQPSTKKSKKKKSSAEKSKKKESSKLDVEEEMPVQPLKKKSKKKELSESKKRN